LRYSCGHVSTKKNVRGIKDAAASTPPQLRSSRYIRYRDNIGYPRYGERYDIGDNQYSSNNLSYCPINRFLESVPTLSSPRTSRAAASSCRRQCQRTSGRTPRKYRTAPSGRVHTHDLNPKKKVGARSLPCVLCPVVHWQVLLLLVQRGWTVPGRSPLTLRASSHVFSEHVAKHSVLKVTADTWPRVEPQVSEFAAAERVC
jgi:hypothetical protein